MTCLYLLELAQYADETTVVATSRSPSLLVSYLEAYLGRLKHLLRDWRIAINVANSTAMLYDNTARPIQKPRPVQFLGEPILWVETERYLGVILDTQLTWAAHTNQVGKRQLKDWACFPPP
jgi:hypothetical protein